MNDEQQQRSTRTPPAQKQAQQPGQQQPMRPQPESIRESYRGSGRLKDKVSIVTGGDSGIGRSVAVHFAREGAKVVVAYLNEEADARATERMVLDEGTECLLFAGDLGDTRLCQRLVDATVERFGAIDILVNNAAEQHPVDQPEALEPDIVERTFRTNIFSFLYLTTAALPHMPDDGTVINTASVTAVRGHRQLLDYSATKGAILAFTMSLAQAVAERGIRVNAVAPGPIWTPLIPSTFDADEVAEFGGNTLFKRPGQPSEVAPAYVFLASEEASYITGQTIHINGGGHISA
jgi:NAD(P)-dependent dehydrogenase (short-subunit alcohol dehydrogenase family)